jgi:hypothetical protein
MARLLTTAAACTALAPNRFKDFWRDEPRRRKFAGIAKLLEVRGWVARETFSMSLLDSSIESNLLTRRNFGLIALTLLGVLSIAIAVMLP